MYISLHIAEPNEANLEATEVAYEGYRPVCLDGLAFAFEGTEMVNVDRVVFPRCTQHPIERTIATHFAYTDDSRSRILSICKLDDELVIRKDEAPGFLHGALKLFPNRERTYTQ